MSLRHAAAIAGLLPIALCAQQTTRLEVSIAGAAGNKIYLANYYGNQLFYSDSAIADAQGLAVFAHKGGYKPGLYAVLPGVGKIPVVLGEPVVKLATTKADPLGQLRVAESRENTMYLVDRKQAETLPEPQRTARLKEIAKAAPDMFASKLILMEMEPEKVEVKLPNGNTDSTATSDRQRAHYWDNTDLGDARIVHAPVFQNRLEVLMAVGVAQNEDAITNYLDSLISAPGTAEAVKQFIVNTAARKYAELPTQGLGAVCVRLTQKHVCTGKGNMPAPGWTPLDHWQKLCVKAAIKASLIPGAASRDIVLADTTGKKWISMHKMPEPCVVVVFWSPHCSHCKQTLPLLYEKYVQELKPLGTGLYAVAETTSDALFKDWKDFVRKNKLDWTNVGIPWPAMNGWRTDPSKYAGTPTDRQSLNYASTWEVTGTPRYYVLDEQRRIVAQPGTLNEVLSTVKALRAK
ncbi:MAG TPA: thioredoxin family protein [Flavobacteriales bacterium]|nr:thioredoxin family protein [Flavobacteriales bacterium]